MAARRRIRTSSSCEDDQDASAIVPALHPSESSDNAEAEVRKADKSSEFETSDGIDEIPTSPDKTMKVKLLLEALAILVKGFNSALSAGIRFLTSA